VSGPPIVDEQGFRAAVMSRMALRDLPWRRTRDPWAVLVAELMLQQTQVRRVEPKWFAFLDRFPTVTACADAPVGRVIESWAGLGYNRRAVQLHTCATQIRDLHGGRVPDQLDGLLELAGIGPYTARAVLAFAFERDVAVVDTNVGRVLARVSGRRLAARDAQGLADRLVPPGQGWGWNQAMLAHGALSCTKRAPRCASCAARPVCGWAGIGDDPAIGSAGVGGRQSRFAGSDREGRGRLVAALRAGAVHRDDLAATMGWTDDTPRAGRVAAGLVRDGLAVRVDDRFALPGRCHPVR
jgi:A/G-specific adenine glycosylase